MIYAPVGVTGDSNVSVGGRLRFRVQILDGSLHCGYNFHRGKRESVSKQKFESSVKIDELRE